MADELAEARAAMEAKLAKKKELLGELNNKSRAVEEAREKLANYMPKGGRTSSPQRLMEEIDHAEFNIATSAFTPAQEKIMIQSLDKVKAELARAMADKASWDKFQAARAEVHAKMDERKAVRDQLDALRNELESTYQIILKLSADRKKEFQEREVRRERTSEVRTYHDDRRKQRDEERKDMEPYLKELDPFVSMDEIAEIKKKPSKTEEAPQIPAE